MSTLIALIRAELGRDVPVVPGSWELVPEDNRWSSIYPLGKDQPAVVLHARLMLRQAGQPQRALFVCTGPAQVLSRLSTAIAADGLPWTQTWASLAALRADAGLVASAVKSAWPDDRPRANTGTLASPVLVPVGNVLALPARMAGALDEDGET